MALHLATSMQRCAFCNARIVFGPARDGDFVYCNSRCREAGPAMQVAKTIPSEVIDQYVTQIHQGRCPYCSGQGPVDVHTVFTVWSALLVTSWKSEPRVACRACGRKGQLKGALFSGCMGWWGFPWGLFITPIQILRNFAGLIRPPEPAQPSDSLRRVASIHLANHWIAQRRAAASSGSPPPAGAN